MSGPVPLARAGAVPPSQVAVASSAADLLVADASPVVQLCGADAASRRAVACAAGRALGARIFRLPAELIPRSPADQDALHRLIGREAVLRAD